VEQKLRDLESMRQALRRIAEACPGTGSVDECPVLNLVAFERSGRDAATQ